MSVLLLQHRGPPKNEIKECFIVYFTIGSNTHDLVDIALYRFVVY